MSFLTRQTINKITKERDKKESQEAEKANPKKLNQKTRKEVIKILLN